MKHLKIGIVGASIAGSAVGIVLHRLGFQVELLEQRSKETFKEQGAGLALPETLLSQLIEEGLLDPHVPNHPLTIRTNYALTAGGNQNRLATYPIAARGINWQHLRDGLMRHLPQELVSYQSKVTDLSERAKTTLVINDSETKEFDIVIFADGYRSFGRKRLFPGIHPHFINTILWRGLLPNPSEELVNEIKNQLQNIFSENFLLALYLIPDLSGKNLLLNWAIHEKIGEDHPLFKDHLHRASHNVAPSEMSPSFIHYLKTEVIRHVPESLRPEILRTERPFIQALHDLFLSNNVQGNQILIGDAATLLLPATASGATKALQDALALGQALEKDPNDIFKALNHWDESQTQTNQSLFQLGRELMDFLLLNSPDWEKETADSFDRKWQSIVQRTNWYMKPQK